jgi:hypothetical protein
MPGIVQSVVYGQPESTKNVLAGRAIRDVANRISYLDPDSAPLTVILSRANSQVANNWKFEWIEKELPARWDAINNGAGYASGATSVVVNNAKFFSVGDLVVITRTGERILVTAVVTGTNTLTIVRGVGYDGTNGFQAAAIVDKDDLLIIGNAYPEGALSGVPKTVLETQPFNYTQIIRTPLAVTRSEQNTQNYGGPDRVRLRYEKGVEHKIDIERTALFGERNISTSGGDSNDNPRRYTGGMFYFLTELAATAKQKDFGGIVTEPEMEDWMQDVFEATGAGDTRTLFCSPLWVSILDQLAQGRLEVTDRAETFGVTVRNLISSHGHLAIVKHRLLQNNPVPTSTTPTGYAGYALALDMTRIKYRFLANSNTSLHTDIQAPDYDGYKDEYLTECGWQLELPKVHGVGKNATG